MREAYGIPYTRVYLDVVGYQPTTRSAGKRWYMRRSWEEDRSNISAYRAWADSEVQEAGLEVAQRTDYSRYQRLYSVWPQFVHFGNERNIASDQQGRSMQPEGSYCKLVRSPGTGTVRSAMHMASTTTWRREMEESKHVVTQSRFQTIIHESPDRDRSARRSGFFYEDHGCSAHAEASKGHQYISSDSALLYLRCWKL